MKHAPKAKVFKDEAYLQRNYGELSRTFERLNTLPRISYDDYKGSKLWDARTDALLDYTGHLCQMCGKPITSYAQLHHHYYVSNSINIVSHENINDVSVIHAGCHQKINWGTAPNTSSWTIYPIMPYTQSAEEW